MNKITFCLSLTCEHCQAKTLFFTDKAETETKCANGTCGKISKFDEAEKQAAYIQFLEDGYDGCRRRGRELWDRVHAKENEGHLVRTANGWRLVTNNFTSIQWAVTPMVNYEQNQKT